MISSTVLIHPTTWFLMGVVLLLLLKQQGETEEDSAHWYPAHRFYTDPLAAG